MAAELDNPAEADHLDVLKVAGEPAGGFQPGKDRVESATGQPGALHELKPVSGGGDVVEEHPQHLADGRGDPHLLHIASLHRVVVGFP